MNFFPEIFLNSIFILQTMLPEKIQITGELLQRLRLVKGIKQRVIAEKLQISQQAYSKIEKSRKIAGYRLKKLLKALNYSAEDMAKLSIIISTHSD
ncbi:MAG TPA: helix-turn-helix transcriptional regulator [Chitinophagaceae bacterium]|nr:helix-turn-helix transcriptional regulator [Chitinophagaceae bacterium]